MARTVILSQSLPHAESLSPISGTAIGAVLLLLRPVARLALAGAHFLVDAGCAWADNRRQREDARHLRDLAASDGRLRADLIALGEDGAA